MTGTPDQGPHARSLYFEDLVDGMVFTTSARTITEADVVQFAMLSGDWNPIHVDAESARSGMFGQRVVHGMAVLSFMGGLMYAAGWFASTMEALLGYEKVEFVAPVFIGDTIHCRMTIGGTRLTSTGKGLVTRHLEVVNQEGRVVQRAISPALISRKGHHDAS